MKIKVIPNNIFIREYCELCGSLTSKFNKARFVVVDGNKEVGFVCEDCVESGEESIRKRMLKLADNLERYVAWLRAKAEEDIILPDLKDMES